MNILYLHQYFATPDSFGGTRSYEMAKRLIDKGHNVTFITTSAFMSEKVKSSLSRGWNFLLINGINVHVLHLPYSNKNGYLLRVIKFLIFCVRSSFKSLSIDSDMVFATSTPLTIAIPGVFYSKIKKVPMVFEVRDLWPEIPIAIGAIRNPIIIGIAKKLEAFAYKHAKRIVTLSPGMCQGVVESGVDSSKISIASNSCDTELFDVDSEVGERYKHTLGFLKDRKLVVYTGTFGVINDVRYIVDLAISSLNSSSNICYVAVGDGKEKASVVDYAREAGVLDVNLYFFDSLPKTEIVKILSAADLSLSLFGPVKEMWNNSANKVFDSLASQTPIAINYSGWQAEFIEEYGCGIVLYGKSADQASREIQNFLNDSIRCNRAKKACKYLAYNVYSRDIMADKLENVLKEALNDK
ncbi:glycosyltransferase family 4 protein [Salinivibrio kushneri]|uniref:Glycosyltransferase WbuB n=1 Tax=Salinivibrio kushneri TaxID=1908198 RepID=A0AB36K684_9GAMM|nr:glycosyltransferase family 4 protein [Salinivibrio kushneri]OOE43959.1 glycosyltransferase WbuB [Salinivibrio kushneri]